MQKKGWRNLCRGGALSVALVTVLAACGGGGGDGNGSVVEPQPAPVQMSLLAGSLASKPDALAQDHCGQVNGVGAQARFSRITDLALSPLGDIYVSEDVYPPVSPQPPCPTPERSRIRRIAGEGVVSTFSTGGDRDWGEPRNYLYPRAIAAGGSGEVFVADGLTCAECAVFSGGMPRNGMGVWVQQASGAVRALAGGGPNSSGPKDGVGAAAIFSGPHAMRRTPDGRLFVLDGNRLRQVTADGEVTTLPGEGFNALAVASNGQLLVARGGEILNYTTGQTLARLDDNVTSMALDSRNGIYVVTSNRSTLVQKLSDSGQLSIVAGRVDSAPLAYELGPLPGKLLHVKAIAFDRQDRLLIAGAYAVVRTSPLVR